MNAIALTTLSPFSPLAPFSLRLPLFSLSLVISVSNISSIPLLFLYFCSYRSSYATSFSLVYTVPLFHFIFFSLILWSLSFSFFSICIPRAKDRRAFLSPSYRSNTNSRWHLCVADKPTDECSRESKKRDKELVEPHRAEPCVEAGVRGITEKTMSENFMKVTSNNRRSSTWQ